MEFLSLEVLSIHTCWEYQQMKLLFFINNYHKEIHKTVLKYGEQDHLWPVISHEVNGTLAKKYNYYYKKVK